MSRRRPLPPRRTSPADSARKRVTIPLDRRHQGLSIEAILIELLPSAYGQPLSKSAIRKLIVAGTVRVGERVLRVPRMTPPPRAPSLTVVIDSTRLKPSDDHRPLTITRRDIVFEDNYLLVVAKPSGFPTHPTIDPKRPNLYASVRDYLAKCQSSAHPRASDQDPYLGLHNRLDVETSGLVVFTKDPSVNGRVADAFAGREISKHYLAVTPRPNRPVPKTFTVDDHLGPVGKHKGRTRYGSVTSGGDHAYTSFEVLDQRAETLLIRAIPRTGRTHQIRVHLASQGIPILGDDLYGTPESLRLRVPRLLLHAERLSLRHPVTGAILNLHCPAPPAFASGR